MDPSTAITAEKNNLLKRSGPEKPGGTAWDVPTAVDRRGPHV